MKSEIVSNQRLPRIEAFGCSASAITENKSGGTFTDNGTGDFTIALARPFLRVPVPSFSALHATLKLYPTIRALTKSSVQVEWVDEGGTARDPTSWYMTLVGSDAADAI
jgi:hypothetical protein